MNDHGNRDPRTDVGVGRPDNHPPPGHDANRDTVSIIVNGRLKQVPKNAELTFDQVVKLAFENPQSGDGIQYTVQYTKGPGNRPSGTLVEGQSVRVKEGMAFDVTPTNRS